MKVLTAILLCTCVLLACKKNEYPKAGNNTHGTFPDSTINNPPGDTVAAKTHVDSLVGTYTGTFRYYSKYVQLDPVTHQTLDSSITDSTYSSILTVKKVSAKQIVTTIKYGGETAVYYTDYVNTNKFKVGPFPGGYELFFYPEGDSVTFLTKGWSTAPRASQHTDQSGRWKR